MFSVEALALVKEIRFEHVTISTPSVIKIKRGQIEWGLILKVGDFVRGEILEDSDY